MWKGTKVREAKKDSTVSCQELRTKKRKDELNELHSINVSKKRF